MLVGLVILITLGLIGSRIGGTDTNWVDRGRNY
jgi:hypothetical protein